MVIQTVRKYTNHPLEIGQQMARQGRVGVRRGLCKTKALSVQHAERFCSLSSQSKALQKAEFLLCKLKIMVEIIAEKKSFSRKPQYTFLEMQVLGMTRAIWEIVWKVSQETSYIEPSILRQLLLKLPHKDGLKQTRKCYKKFK